MLTQVAAIAGHHRFERPAHHQRSCRFHESADLLARHQVRLIASFTATPRELHKPQLDDFLRLEVEQSEGERIAHGLAQFLEAGTV